MVCAGPTLAATRRTSASTRRTGTGIMMLSARCCVAKHAMLRRKTNRKKIKSPGGPRMSNALSTRRPPGFLDREHIVAGSGFNRWLVPPAALCVHLCIGQVYAFSVFNLPMTRAARHHQIRAGRLEAHRARLDLQHWRSCSSGCPPPSLGTVARAGGAAQGDVRRGRLLRRRLPDRGPRRQLHVLWLIYLGYGVIGGFGLGIGYISPVSTLIKWFPDRPGMATGMAIMGFGGGAMIASPLVGGADGALLAPPLISAWRRRSWCWARLFRASWRSAG